MSIRGTSLMERMRLRASSAYRIFTVISGRHIGEERAGDASPLKGVKGVDNLNKLTQTIKAGPNKGKMLGETVVAGLAAAWKQNAKGKGLGWVLVDVNGRPDVWTMIAYKNWEASPKADKKRVSVILDGVTYDEALMGYQERAIPVYTVM